MLIDGESTLVKVQQLSKFSGNSSRDSWGSGGGGEGGGGEGGGGESGGGAVRVVVVVLAAVVVAVVVVAVGWRCWRRW